VPTPDALAIDIAILLPKTSRALVVPLNESLTAPPQGFRFDRTHLPHVTLAQLLVSRNRLANMTEAVGRVLQDVPPLELTTASIRKGHTASNLAVLATPTVTCLHRRLMAVLAPFECYRGSISAFHPDEPQARPADLNWVTNYRRQASHTHYDPHITIGIGVSKAIVEPLQFIATRIAACHLGCFCTCRERLATWTLTAMT